jgi:hypothetical protein
MRSHNFTISQCSDQQFRNISPLIYGQVLFFAGRNPIKLGAESWERVVFSDSWQRLIHHASLAAYYSSQRRDDRALVKVAAAIFEKLLDPDAPRYGDIPAGM